MSERSPQEETENDRIDSSEDKTVVLTATVVDSDEIPDLSEGDVEVLNSKPDQPFRLLTTAKTVEKMLTRASEEYDE